MVAGLGLHVCPHLPPGQPVVTAHWGEGAGHQGAGADQGLVPGEDGVTLLTSLQVQTFSTLGAGQALVTQSGVWTPGQVI